MKKKLILFDIDGTLVKSRGMGVSGYMLKVHFGIEPFETKVYMEGKTMRAIMIERLREAGIKNPEKDPRFERALRDEPPLKLVTKYSKHRLKVKRIEYVEALLKKLKKEGYVLGLLTGNSRYFSKIKLKKARLWDYFRLGAYGSETNTRSELVPIAIKEAKKQTGKKFQLGDVLLIGDTVADIRCAKEAGVKILAFSTGNEPFQKLKKERPNFLFKDFKNIKKITEAIQPN